MKPDSAKLDYVDALRGIAILMVILVHTVGAVPDVLPITSRLAMYGQLGVQLFFVASAYTLCISYDRRTEEPYRVLSFFIRRLFRIAPLYYFGVLIYLVFNVLVVYRDDANNFQGLPYSALDIVANMLFVHGLVPSANNTVVPGGWSIGAEMLFYAAFPALFAATRRVAKSGPWALPALVLVGTTLYVLAQTMVYRSTGMFIHNSSFFYFSIINQFPAFALGAAAYFLCRDRPDWCGSSWRPLAMAFGIITVIAVVMWLLDFALLFTIIPAVSALSFVFLLNWLRIGRVRLPFLQAVGKVSFSLYILHFLFAYYAVPSLLRALQLHVNPELTLLFAFALVFAFTWPLAIFTEQTIEARGITIGKKIIARLQSRLSSRYLPLPASR
jgi:peptidoglycan/LPS O-acetylase OafA/YrhL